MNDFDLIKFYKYTNKLRSSLNYYIGKEDLYKVWFGRDLADKLKPCEIYHKIIRLLSKYFLDHHANNWILRSRKMKK